MVSGVRREAVFHSRFIEDLSYFVAKDRKVAMRLLDLVQSILRDPFVGTGKPEPLKGMGPNTCSRRLTDEHRIVYVIANDRVYFVQARFHY
jgi:toxin YoeB